MRYGFTLIELLTVVGIIVILAGLSFGVFTFAQAKTKLAQAEAQLTLLDNGIEQYHAEIRSYPEASGRGSEEESLLIYKMCFGDGLDADGIATISGVVNGEPDDSATIYVDDLDPQGGSAQKWFKFESSEIIPKGLYDPWGEPWHYRDGASNVDAENPDFDLWSKGPDRKTGTPETETDDIRNW